MTREEMIAKLKSSQPPSGEMSRDQMIAKLKANSYNPELEDPNLIKSRREEILREIASKKNPTPEELQIYKNFTEKNRDKPISEADRQSEIIVDPVDFVPTPGALINPAVGAAREATESGIAKLLARKEAGAPANKLREFFGRLGTGMEKGQAEAFMKDPAYAKHYASLPELQRSEEATKKIQDVASGINSKFAPLEESIQKSVQGKYAPIESVQGTEAYLPKQMQNLTEPDLTKMMEGERVVPVSNLLKINRELKNKQTAWTLDPSTGAFTKANDPTIGSLVGRTKQYLPDEVKDNFSKMSDLYDSQQFINKALNTGRPLGALKSTQPDVEAMKQLADKAAGGSGIKDISSLEQITGILNPKSSQPLTKEGVVKGLTKESGLKLLESSAKKRAAFPAKMDKKIAGKESTLDILGKAQSLPAEMSLEAIDIPLKNALIRRNLLLNNGE